MSTCTLYTVYDNHTDELVMIDGIAKECAKRMNVKVTSFYSILSRFTTGIKTRWAIVPSDKISGVPRDTTEFAQKTFGQKIRYWRYRKGMTIVELSNAVGVCSTTISLLERDLTEPSFLVVTCIADVFGVSLDYLAGRKKDYRVDV